MKMEEVKQEKGTVKTIVPIKGNLLEKVKYKLQQKNKTPAVAKEFNNNQNTNANCLVKNELQSPDNKVIIHTVEKVHIDVSSILQNDASHDINRHFDEITNHVPKIEEPPQEKSTIKVLTAKMPENEFNKKIPLKITRKIKAPKPAINVPRKRLFDVRIDLAATSTPTESNESSEFTIKVQEEESKIIKLLSEEHATTSQKESPVEEFKGFQNDEIELISTENLKLWEETLMPKDNQVKNESAIISSPLHFSNIASSSKRESKESEKVPEESEIITNSMVDSSMMREFAQDLSETKEIEEDSSSFDEEMEESDDEEDNKSEIMDADEAYWLNDIAELIGENRIKEIDQSLKKIPSVATGNRIETENIELKLIVNHLLKKLNAQSVIETLDPTENDTEVQKDSTHFKDEEMQVEKPSNIKDSQNSLQDEDSNHFEDPCDDIPQDNEPSTSIAPSTSFPIDKNEPKNKNEEELKVFESPNEKPSRKRKKELMPLATSTLKKMKPATVYDLLNPEVNEKEVAEDTPKKKRGRPAKKKIPEVVEKFTKQKIIEKSPSPPPIIKIIETREEPRNIRPRRNSKIVSDSKSSTTTTTTSDTAELKLCENNFNSPLRLSPPLSQPNSNNDDYLNSSHPDLDNNKKVNPIVEEVQNVVKKSKDSDLTFREPPEAPEKRPYLRTSAFNGNVVESEVNSSTSDDNDSVSDDSMSSSSLPPATQESKFPPSLKDVMNSLIEGKTVCTSEKQQSKKVILKKKKKKKEKLVKKIARTKNVCSKRVFEQEPLQKAIASQVPYEKIIESIRVSDPPRGKASGKALWNIPAFPIEEKERIRKELEKLKYFKCGMCQFNVTKHLWKDHLELHGGFAFIEGFEEPLNILDWHESLRRMMQYSKIYDLIEFTCPHCEAIKKSALGQLSHLYVCGEDSETIEDRKVQCESCESRVMPYSLSLHRRSCKGMLRKEEKFEKESDDDDEEEEKGLGGRKKRKAVKQAEKKFKNILKSINHDDHIEQLSDGESKCNLCTKKFSTHEKALNHLEKDHKIQKEDFGSDASSDDFKQNDGDESSETEGSSGVDEEEQNSSSHYDDDDENSNQLNSSGRVKLDEPQEAKNSRALVSGYVDYLRTSHSTGKVFDLTKQYEILSDEILPQAIPKFKISTLDLETFLTRLNLKPKSMKFLINQVSNYRVEFTTSFEKQEWQRIDAGSDYKDDNQSRILYCGGSISAIDWAPSNNDNNFLAVAVNSESKVNVGIVQTIKSCVQIYEFQSLVNDRFHNFEKVTSSLLYTFVVNEGPIWSIKFHPCGNASYDRIGILAITTAQQDILVYSLPYLNNSLIVKPEPFFVCRLAEETIFYHDSFLLQATHVNWLYHKNYNNILTAGYINGYVGVWNLKGKEESASILPNIVIQAHREPIVAVDTKIGKHGQFFLLTASLGREIKLFSIENSRFEELAIFNPTSRTFCAQFLLNWPSFIFGNDNCFSIGNLTLRQPFEFGNRNVTLMSVGPSIVNLDISQWTTTILFTTESGDVLGCKCKQLINNANVKDRWSAFESSILSYADYKWTSESEMGIIFNDMISNFTKKPKHFRAIPAELTNQLQINQVCLNRNEKSHRFYALAYETGFIRIKHLKNFSK